jgi:hypothetical protein
MILRLPSRVVTSRHNPNPRTQAVTRVKIYISYDVSFLGLDLLVLWTNNIAEENSIFAQGLIALCNLKPASINLWFDKDDASEGMNGKDVIVKPCYMGDEDEDDKPEKYEVLFKEWQQSVDPEAKGERNADSGGGKMKFGHSDDSPW